MTLVVKRIASLIIKQWRGELTIEETIELDQWAAQSEANRELLQVLTHDETLRHELITYYEGEEAREAIWKKIDEATSETTQAIPMPVHHQRKYRYMAAAVTVTAILTSVAYFWFQRNSKPATTPVAQIATTDVLPGGNKAILKLSDGKTIVLDNANNGLLTTQGAVQIEKQDGQLEYKQGAGTAAVAYNTLSTPVGGQFQIKLPDGTRVWLNAASSITYPTAFTSNERRVSITGEGYFEVTKDARKPFIVDFLPTTGGVGGGRVEVLGTHFNINAYDDEEVKRTTLLEGKIRVTVAGGQPQTTNHKPQTLNPGEQAVMAANSPLTIHHSPDLEEVVAWKNGEFLFQGADIGTVMRQVARWYDIEVSYPNGKPKDKFRGKIGRNVNLSQLLEILKYSEVRFDLKGRTLVIYN